MRLRKMKNFYSREQKREIDFWFSEEGAEIQVCLVAQGYKEILFYRFILLFPNETSKKTSIKLIIKIIKSQNMLLFSPIKKISRGRKEIEPINPKIDNPNEIEQISIK